MNGKALLSRLAIAGVSVVVGCADHDERDGSEGVFNSTGGAPVASTGGSFGGVFTNTIGGSTDGPSAGGASTSASAAPAAPAVPVAPALLGDPQILHVATTAIQAQVDQASVALTRARASDVQKFAMSTLSGHGSAYPSLDLVQRVGFSTNRVSVELTEKATATLAQLNGGTDDEFDELYLNTQAAACEDVLALIDDELVPHAERSQVRDYLQAFRDLVSETLDSVDELAGSASTISER
jgi:predicted outer membrane protein